MAASTSLTRTYTDRKYVHTTVVQHEGVVVAFAMASDRRILYSVLNLDGPEAARGEIDAAYWGDNPSELRFPTEIAEVGYAVAGATRIPTVTQGGGEGKPGEHVPPGAADPFRSSTARLGAAAPFHVVSDGAYLLVYRQSIAGDHPDALYKLTNGGSSGDQSRSDLQKSAAGAKVPLVDRTLLCDRFVRVGAELRPVRQVRYRRSRHATLPASATDTLGTRDMDGVDFYEPTLELSFVRHLSGGAFAVLLLPTMAANTRRWQLFTRNDRTKRIDTFSVEQSADGLFNTQGTVFYTSPDPKYQTSVLERAPGQCPFTKQPLVPAANPEDRGGYGLKFNGTGAYVQLGNPPALRLAGAYTVEAWVKPDQPGGSIVSKWNGTGTFDFRLQPDGKLALVQGGRPGALTSTGVVPTGVYTHVAATFDQAGGVARLFINGQPASEPGFNSLHESDLDVLVGACHVGGQPGSFFSGEIDEVRIWARVRTREEIDRDRRFRLAGSEPGLLACFRLDEGLGDTVYDQSGSALTGTLVGGPSWVVSGAPIGLHPGVSRRSFSFQDRTVASGVTATLYHPQENVPSGSDKPAKPRKTLARVLLACPTTGSDPLNEDPNRAYVAAVDLAVGKDGRLADPPAVIALPASTEVVEPSADLQAVQQEIKDLDQRVADARSQLTGRDQALEATKLAYADWTEARQREAESPELAAVAAAAKQEFERLLAELQKLYALAKQTDGWEAVRTAKQERLARLTNGLGGGRKTVPMAYLGMDRRGLSYSGGLLTFAWTDRAPALLAGGDGEVILYFRGAHDQFFAAYYHTTVTRAVNQLAVGGQMVRFVNRNPAVDTFTVTVTAGSDADHCQVTVVNRPGAQQPAPEREEFPDVPRQVGKLAAVLNGDRSTGYDFTKVVRSRPGAGAGPGSELVMVDAGGVSGAVADGSAAQAATGLSCRWHGAAAGRAREFAGSGALVLQGQLSPNGVERNVTVEAWCRPGHGTGEQRVVYGDTGDHSYTLGVTGGVGPTAIQFGAGYVETDGVDLAETDFTIECWARRYTTNNSPQWILAHGHMPGGLKGQTLHLGFRGNKGPFAFAFHGDDLDVPMGSEADLLAWHHWAAVYQRASQTQILYRDGVEVGRRTATGHYLAPTRQLMIGGRQGQMGQVVVDELRVWGHARTEAQVRDHQFRRLTGKEGGLRGYWSFDSGQVTDKLGSGQPLDRHGDLATVASPLSVKPFAAAGDLALRAQTAVPPGEWLHLAASYRQAWALRFPRGSNAHLDVPHTPDLDLIGDFTIEALVHFEPEEWGGLRGLIGKGNPGTEGPDQTAYCLYIDSHGRPALRVDRGPIIHVANAAVPRGRPVWVAATLEGKAPPAGTAAGSAAFTMRFYIDGHDAGSYSYTAPRPTGNNRPLQLGRAFATEHGGAELRGAVCEVRLWRAVREKSALGGTISKDEDRLVAWWRFQEGEGHTARSEVGGHVATLRYGAEWIPSPYHAASSLRLYRNGVPVATDPVPREQLLATGADQRVRQLTVGARLRGTDLLEPLHGRLDEIRVWRTVRTEEEILDNLFGRLENPGKDLVAYYPFDTDSIDPAAPARDAGLLGHHLVAKGAAPALVLSHAPVGEDAAEVRSALSPVTSRFQDTTDTTPTVAEYADSTRDPRGGIRGTLKRCYSYLRGGAWHLLTGYKVGALVSEWIGQAQFDPHLIGYVEGAPPVPGENLVAGPADPDRDNYANASKVTFVQADEVITTVASRQDLSVNAALKLAGAVTYGTAIWSVSAPLGVGTAQPLVENSLEIAGGFSVDTAQGWTNEGQLEIGRNTSRSSSARLAGYWENPAAISTPDLGRRYLLHNTGLAVVQSQTADLFALRLARNNALVAYRLLPNPDIPRDWNIVAFPINPRYVKQGTLDGCVGYRADGRRNLDPDYAGAAHPGEHSYYKPREAYAIKRRIQEDQQRLQGLLESIRTSWLDPFRETAAQSTAGAASRTGALPTGADDRANRAMARRNIANTYVWTAKGGLFTETTGTIDVTSETMGGSATINFAGTYSVSGSMDAFGGSISGGREHSLGSGHTTTRARTRKASTAFQVEVECAPSGDLQRYDNGKAVYTASGKPEPMPGRVDAYRFMTFYLDSGTANFEDFFAKVVDPMWLQGNEPGAAALRQANQADHKPPCWRVLHRVTYVSRVLPATLPPDAPPVQKALHAQNFSSDYELIQQLDPYVRPAATSYAELAAATRKALADRLPELVPHAEAIAGFLARYYGIDTMSA